MKYQANPVIVEAHTVISIDGPDICGYNHLLLDNETLLKLDDPIIPCTQPQIGDYVVTRANGHVSVEPKAMFEHKYSPLPVSAEKAA